jgi:hypothetical protein
MVITTINALEAIIIPRYWQETGSQVGQRRRTGGE